MISPENRARFEQAGRMEVRRRLDGSLYSGDDRREAEDWLDEQESGPERALARDANELARNANEFAREANAAAFEANRLASRANWIAIAAFIASATAVAISASSLSFSIPSWLLK
jgi:hypothetical protein